MTTGIFYSHIFKTSPGPVIGPKFINFPEVLEDVLKLPNVRLFEHKPVSEDLILRFHTREMIENLKDKPYGKNAFYSVGACIEASKKIMGGELKNGCYLIAHQVTTPAPNTHGVERISTALYQRFIS